jgi:hypothetical protein
MENRDDKKESRKDKTPKKSYVKPVLVIHGSLMFMATDAGALVPC